MRLFEAGELGWQDIEQEETDGRLRQTGLVKNGLRFWMLGSVSGSLHDSPRCV